MHRWWICGGQQQHAARASARGGQVAEPRWAPSSDPSSRRSPGIAPPVRPAHVVVLDAQRDPFHPERDVVVRAAKERGEVPAVLRLGHAVRRVGVVPAGSSGAGRAQTMPKARACPSQRDAPWCCADSVCRVVAATANTCCHNLPDHGPCTALRCAGRGEDGAADGAQHDDGREADGADRRGPLLH